MKKSILVVTDNIELYNFFYSYIQQIRLNEYSFDFVHSPETKEIFSASPNIRSLTIKDHLNYIINKYDKIFSLHCKQFFPKNLVQQKTCINIHPGHNPQNRGWYPQVFSIINNTIIGATMHLMDEKLDHGEIIERVEVEKYSWDTSLSLYNRVVEAEKMIIKKNLLKVLEDNYTSIEAESRGFISNKKDFEELCLIDLNEKADYKSVINKLRALTHGNYKNAYFFDEKEQKKVYITVNLEVSNEK